MVRDGRMSRSIFAAIIIGGQCPGASAMVLVRWLKVCMRSILIRRTMNKHGFAGFHTSVWESDVNVRHLCFLKSCGMGHPDAMKPFEAAERGEGAISSFDEELELLMFDM